MTLVKILSLISIVTIITGCIGSTDSRYSSKPSTQSEHAPLNTSSCHPNYSGCLKADASDYDCTGGSGNGPYYTGKVKVTGPDVFDLDRDSDGWGCE